MLILRREHAFESRKEKVVAPKFENHEGHEVTRRNNGEDAGAQ